MTVIKNNILEYYTEYGGGGIYVYEAAQLLSTVMKCFLSIILEWFLKDHVTE